MPLANGIPAHDTLARVLSRISAGGFEQCFASWVSGCAEVSEGEVVAIDGKTLRRSHDRRARKGALHGEKGTEGLFLNPSVPNGTYLSVSV